LSGTLYLDCMQNSGNLPIMADDPDGKRKSEGLKVLEIYNAMAFADEKQELMAKDGDSGPTELQAGIIKKLTNLLIKRICEVWGSGKPKHFGKQSVYVSTLVNAIRQSRIVVSASAFAAWRRGGDASGGKRTTEPEEREPRKSPRPLGAPAREVASDDDSHDDESHLFGDVAGTSADPVLLEDSDMEVSEQEGDPW
jgi:hypothetical protein